MAYSDIIWQRCTTTTLEYILKILKFFINNWIHDKVPKLMSPYLCVFFHHFRVAQSIVNLVIRYVQELLKYEKELTKWDHSCSTIGGNSQLWNNTHNRSMIKTRNSLGFQRHSTRNRRKSSATGGERVISFVLWATRNA